MNGQPKDQSFLDLSPRTHAAMIVLIGLLLLGAWAPGAYAAVCQTAPVATPPMFWTSAGDWSCGKVPDAGDDVEILHDVYFNQFTGGANSLVVNSGVTLDLAYSSGGTLTVSNGLVVDQAIVDTFSSGATVVVSGGSISSSLTGLISTPVQISGAVSVSSGLVTFNNSVLIDPGVTLTNNGDARFNSGISGSGTFVSGAGSTTRLGGGTVSVTNFDPSGAGSSFRYLAASPTVRGGAGVTYDTLWIQTTGTATLDSAVSIATALSIQSGIFSDAGFAIAATGANLGIAADSSFHIFNTAPNPFPDFATFAIAADPDPNACCSAAGEVAYVAEAAQNVPGFTPGGVQISYGQLRIDSNNYFDKTLVSGPAQVRDDLIVDNTYDSVIFDYGATFLIGSGVVEVGGSVDGGGEISMTTGQLLLGGDWFGWGNLTAGSGTVTYNGDGAQTIGELTYYNLTVGQGTDPDYVYAQYGNANVSNQLLIDTGGKLELRGSKITPTDAAGTPAPGTGSLKMNAGAELYLGSNCGSAAPMPDFGTFSLDPASLVSFEAEADQLVPISPVYGNVRITSVPVCLAVGLREEIDPESSRLGGAGSSRRRPVQTPNREFSLPLNAVYTKTAVPTPSSTLPGAAVGTLTIGGGLEILNDLGQNDTNALDMNSASLSVAADISGDGNLSFTGASDSMTVGGNFTVDGIFSRPDLVTMTGASLSGSGLLRDGQYGDLVITGGDYSLHVADTFFAPGTVQVDAGARLDLGSYSPFVISASVSGEIAGTSNLRISNSLSGTNGLLNLPVTIAGFGATSTGSLQVTGDLTIFSSSSLTNGGVLDVNGNIVDSFAASPALIAGSGSTLSVGGAAGIDSALVADFATNPNLLIFDGGNQPIPGIAFSDLQLSGSGIKTPAGNLSAVNLTVDTGVTLDAGNNQYTLSGDLTVPGTLNAGTSSFVFSGDGASGGPELITGTLTFSSLTISTSDADSSTIDVEIPAGSAVTVSSFISLADDVLRTTSPLVIGTGVTSIAATTGWVDGPIQKTFGSIGETFEFPVGAGGVKAPLTLTADSTPITFTIGAIDGQHPNAPANSLGMFWNITSTGGQADAVFQYDDSDVTGTEGSYVLGRWNGTAWVVQNAVIDTTGNTATVNNVTQFSPWTLLPNAACQVVTTIDGGAGSLRQAILDANAGTCNSITFAIAGTGPHTLALASNLPILSQDGVTIDGFTQSGASANTAGFGSASNANHQIVITGSSPSINALQINGSNNVVTGLSFAGLTDAILVSGTLTSSNVISGNVFHSSNRGVIVNTGSGNVVGGAAAADRNVFDNMSGSSVQLDGSSAGTTVRGNYIGFDPSGFTPSGNFGFGILVQGSANNTIEQNVVSNSGLSTGHGIEINGNNNTITNNRIGTTLSGTGAMANGSSGGSVGVALVTGTSNTVSGNLISGHDQGGISQFESGIYVSSSNNDIFGNLIGTDVSGSGSIPNRFGIIFDTGSTGNVVGGGLGANTIMNSVLDGIMAVGGSGNKWVDNVISANGAMAVDLNDDDTINDDAGDADSGANGLQNPPTITSAVLASGTLYTTVSLDSSTPNPGALLIEIVQTDGGGQINASVGTQCVAGSVLVNAPVNLPAGALTSGNLIAALATSYSDGSCTTVSEGSSEVGTSFTVVANTAPVAGDDIPSTSEDTAVTFAAGSNDSDAESGVTFVSSTAASNGTADCSAYPNCTYTPSANFNGTDSFTYTIQDAYGLTDTATVTVTVNPVNDPPVAVDDSATAAFETAITIPVLANDTDLDGDALTVASAGSAANGTVACTSADCTYTPDSGFAGADNFTYTVSDGQGGTAVGTVTVTVAAATATDLQITKSGPATGTRGETVSFTIAVKNLGLVDAAGVSVADPEPVGLTHLSNSGDCTTSFPCALGTVPAGATKTIVATYMIKASAPRTVTNSATVTTSTPEATLTNNSSSAMLSLCPLTPTAVQPVDGAASVPRSGSLQWSDARSNVYEVYFGPAGSGCSTLVARTAGTSFPYSGLSEDQDYEWRVIATGTGCADAASSCQTFTTGSNTGCPTDRPELLEPVPSATVSSPVSFTWTAVDGAVSYDVVVDQGTGPVVVASTTTASASVVLTPGSFTWYVEAHFEGGCSTASLSSTFTVGNGECAEESPVLLSPAEGATGLSSPLEFSWLVVPGATSYRVWVESEGSFPVVVGTTAGTSLIATVPSGELHWYVQALFDGCPPTISEIRTVHVDARDGCSIAVPELTGPAFDVAIDSPVTFSWTPVSGAIRYAVWASIDGDTESIIGTTEGEDSTTLEREMDAGEIEWFVEVFFDGCPSTRTEPSRFRVNDNFVCVTDVPELLLPANGATGLPGLVKFEWMAVPTAVGYRLWMRTDGVGEYEMAASTLAETELSLPVRGNMAEWYVEAVFPAPCQPTQSEESSFQLKPPISCTDDEPGLIAPVGGITLGDRRVKLMWTGVEGAAAYNVWVTRENGAPSRVGLTSSDELSIEVDLEEGTHEWWVTALFAGCSPAESSRQTFVVDEQTPEGCESNSQLLLISPAEGAANVVSPVIFEWTEVSGAIGYQIWLLEGENDTKRALGGVRETTQAVVQTEVGTIRWYVEAYREECEPVVSSIQHFKVKPAGLTCEIPDKPQVYVPQKVASGTEYRISWAQVPGATVYEVQESTSRVFRDLPTRVVRGTSTPYMHTLSSQGTFYYRVRAIGDCNGERSSYSPVSVVTVDPNSSGPEASIKRGYHLSAEDLAGSEILELNKDAFSQNGVEEFVVVLRSSGAEPETVRLIPDQSWMTVDPEVVTLTPAGVSVTVRAHMAALPLGTSSATLRYQTVDGGKGASQGGGLPVSVSLVTPVAQAGKNKPLPESLVIPAVAHADGANSTWLSDIRLTNIGAVTQKYQLNFTPAGVDGTQTGKTTNLEVKPGSTVALNDILANWYGAVGVEAQQTGMLEIRPMKSSTSSSIGGLAAVASGGFTSMASSRTYNFTPNGTFGQFIPAVRFEKFVGVETDEDGSPRLSMQQVSQSSSFRTNLGIVEASGNAVDALVSVFDQSGSLLGSFTESLKPGEHKQLNSVLQAQGISVENGRIEVTAANGQGRLMAYGSVVDNTTNDPQLVPAATLGTDSGTKWVLPGVADLVTGQASWRTDVRILNADSQPREVKLTYYPQNNPGVSKEATVMLNAGEIEVLDNVLNELFGESNTGGVVHVETEASSNLVTTGRTYNLEADGGTFGQFIPAVNAGRAVGRGEQALQVMQVEQSDRFRANLGLAEVTGQPAQVEITAVIPGSKTSVKALVPLEGNEFTQLVGVLKSLGISEAYNARISVRVVNGSGRVVAYGSIIDNETQDPTYVPAQ